MAYCPECDSEIAENDIFCPYCGISLKPLTMANGDDSASEAIVAPQPVGDFEEVVGGAQSAVRQPENAQSEESGISTNLAPKIFPIDSADEGREFFGYSADRDLSNTNLEDSRLNTEPGEMPQAQADAPKENNISNAAAPENIEVLKPLVENDANELALSATTSDEPETQNQTAEPETSVKDQPIVSDIGEKEKTSETQNESSIMNYEEAEVKEGDEVYEAELSGTESASTNESDPDFTATMPYIPSDSQEVINSFRQNSESVQIPANTNENSVQQAEISAPQKDLEFDNPAFEPIAKPVVELETPEVVPSKFDSVRIMEAMAPARFVEKITPPAESQSKEETAQKQEPVKEGRSFTTPNIGTTDTDGKKSAKLKPLDEGTVLNGRYEIVRKIGGGGMGAVYLASDKNLGGVLRAVKEMVQSYIEGEQQEKAVNDFKRESLLLTSLEHQSIPTIYDYFFDETEARFYLVMKYISGGDLASRLRSASEGRIDEQSVTEWAIQVADVLDYLHNRQPPIVYRDLKPANIMIDGNTGRVMLIDFGIARWVNKEEKGVTAIGTMGYAPPELFSGNVEPRSDIYSLGSTMFHLLTGADPQSNPLLIFDFQKHPRPRQINPQLSDQMERILMRAVEYNADKRFASAAELRAALEEHLKNLKANAATFGVKDAPKSISLSEQPVFCGFCGQKIVATDMFCAFCGAKQPLAQQGVQPQNYTAPKTAQLLIVGTNDLETPAFRIEKDENLVGRRDPMSNIFPEVDLSKFDPQTKISRKHAKIWRDGSNFMVEDLGSSNGTLVLPLVSDTVRLQPHQPYTLANGDKLRLGDTTLHFVVG